MKSSPNLIILGVGAVLVIGGGIALATMSSKGKGGSAGGGGGASGGGGAQIPGELTENWGTTPANLRPLFLLAEKAAGVPGSARLFAVLAKLQSGFNTDRHDQSQTAKQASQGQYLALRSKRPSLMPDAASSASNFGRGGLFSFLGPEFLWSGYQEMGPQAPLLSASMNTIYDQRYSLFAAAMRMQEVLAQLTASDGPVEAGVGMYNPELLTSRDTQLYKNFRQAFVDASRDLGINLTKIPKPASVNYPGAATALNMLNGAKKPSSGGIVLG